MTHSESDNTRKNSFEESPTRESIREWRTSMETFFNEDWQQVGEIITRLEDSLWDQSHGEAEDSQNEQDRGSIRECHQQIDAMGKTRVPVSSDPEQKVRLENLARKIEDRLNHTHNA